MITMEPTNNLLAHSSLSFYPSGISSSVSGILSTSPASQDSVPRSALPSQNGWGNYNGDTPGIVPHNSCSMSTYSNLQLAPSFSMNGKASAYNSAFGRGADYLSCGQMQLNHPMRALGPMPMSNYPYIGDVYQAGHSTSNYANSYFTPDISAGIPPLPGRDVECRSGPVESSPQGRFWRGTITFCTCAVVLPECLVEGEGAVGEICDKGMHLSYG